MGEIRGSIKDLALNKTQEGFDKVLAGKEEKFILDACCGGRHFWFNKHHPNALYVDIRKEGPGLCKERPNFAVEPDEIMDFRDLKFPDGNFKLVVWDPPHLKRLGATSILKKKYGSLNAQTWPYDLSKGFSECWRVLSDYGVLIFKWCEKDIPLATLLELFRKEPLFGHTTGSKSKTHWLCFMKIPTSVQEVPPVKTVVGVGGVQESSDKVKE